MPPTPQEKAHFDRWMAFTAWVADHYCRWEVTGREHLPPDEQGYVLACNHDAFVDAFVLAAAVGGRYLRILGAGSMMSVPVLGGVLQSIGMKGAKVDQGRAQDKQQTQAVLLEMADHARRGEAVMVFPEGTTKTWNHTQPLWPFRLGAVKVAAMAGVPVVPAAMAGTLYTAPVWRLPGEPRQLAWLPLLLPSKVLVQFGAPFTVNPQAAHNATVAAQETERLRAAIERLRAQLQCRYNGPWR